MLKVECEACKAPYQVDERRVPPTGLKMRCPKCGHSFIVAHPNAPAPAPAAAAPRPAAPGGPPRPSPKTTITGVGSPVLAPPDPFANLPASKPAPASPFGARPPPAPPPVPAPLGGIDELMDLPAIPDDTGLPAVARPGPAKPSFPGAKPPPKPQPPSLSDFEIDLPAGPEVNLPAAKPGKGGLTFDVDLPSPTAELPSAKAPFGAGRRDHTDLPAVAANLPVARGGQPSTKTALGFGELDLPSVGGNLPAVPGRDHNLPATASAGLPLPVVGGGLPVVASAGLPSALRGELPEVANALPQVSNALPQVANALPQVANTLPQVGSSVPPAFRPGPIPDPMETDFGELELKSVPPPPRDDVIEELELPPAQDAQRRSTGGVGFGEVDLGGDTGESVATEDVPRPSGPAKAGGGEAALPTSPQVGRRERAEEVERRPSRAPKLIAVFFGVVVIAGALMQLTPYGMFGYVFLDDLVHETGWTRLADEASRKARAGMASDTYDDAQKALDELMAAHADSPRAKPLTAYTALAEYEFEMRFGRDGARAARAQSWLSELTSGKGAKASDIRYMPVALAAQSAAGADAASARAALDAQSKRDVGDPIQQDIAFLRGELELSTLDAAAASAAFNKALQLAPGARAHFGLARASYLAGDLPKASSEVAATLAASPRHAGALVLRAAVAWNGDRNEVAATKDLHQVLDGAAKAAASPADTSRALSLMGWILSARGKATEAKDAFEKALKLDGRNVDALIGEGEVLYTEGRSAEALSRFDTAVQIEPRNVRAIISDAKAKIANERLADAKAQLVQARTAFPNDVRIAYWLGKVEDALGNKKAAEDAYIAGIAIANPAKPEAIEPYVALAEMLAGQGRAVEAQAKLNEAKSKLPDSAAMQRALGEVAAVQGQYDDAITHYQAAIQKDPDDLSSRFLLGVTYRRMQKVDLASAEFDKVYSVDKDYPNLAMERGLLFEQSGQIDKALEQFQAALSKAPEDLDLQLRVGAALVGVRHADEALKILRNVIGKRPNSAEVNHYLGRAWFLEGASHVPEAIRYLKRAVDLDPNRAEYHLYLAWAATESNPPDIGTAAAEVEKALTIDKLYGDAYWQRGVVEDINQTVDDAIKDLKHALQLRPTRYEAHATLADCYEKKNNLPEAMAEWAKAIAGDDQRSLWRYRYGKLLFDKGNFGAALPHLAFATTAAAKEERAPGWAPDAEFKVAKSYFKTGHKQDAVDHFNRFLDAATPTNPDRREALADLATLGAPRDH